MLLTVRLVLAAAVMIAVLALEPKVEAQARPLRVAFLGDSLTYGLNATTPATMYRQLLVERIHGDRPIGEVVAVFQDPYGLTDDALLRVDDVVRAQPDVIILEIGNHEVFAGEAFIAVFPQLYDTLLYQLQLTGATVIVSTPAWLGYVAESREYRDALRIDAEVRRLAARRGLAVADLWTPTVGRADLISRPGDPNFIPPYDGDDLHPNDAGHRVLADAFWTAYLADRAQRALRDAARGGR